MKALFAKSNMKVISLLIPLLLILVYSRAAKGFHNFLAPLDGAMQTHFIIITLSFLTHLHRELVKVDPPQCLKITEKVSFYIASEASYAYILSGQKLIKNAKNGPFWRDFKYLKLVVKQCYLTGQF